MLARLEKKDGIRRVWTDRKGARLVLALEHGARTERVLSLVGEALAPRYNFKVLRDEAAADEALAGSREWLSREETFELSRDEAVRLGRRAAQQARSRASLDDETTARLEGALRAAWLRMFRDYHEGRAVLTGRDLDGRWRNELEVVVAEVGLSSELAERFRRAFDEEAR